MIRLIIALVLSVVFLIFVLQNLKSVQLNFLFWQFNGSLALILILVFIIAVIVCLLTYIPFTLKKKMNKKSVNEAEENTKSV